MQPDITRLSLGTGDVQPATMSSMYNGGAARSSQYTPRQMIVTDITKEFSDASAGMSDIIFQSRDICVLVISMLRKIFRRCVESVWIADVDRIAAGTIGQR